MVDADPVYQIVGDPRRDLLVRRIEHRGILHPHRGEIVDGEEAAVSDQPRVPRHEPVGLPRVDLLTGASSVPGAIGNRLS